MKAGSSIKASMASIEDCVSRFMSRQRMESTTKDFLPQGTLGSPVIFTPETNKKIQKRFYNVDFNTTAFISILNWRNLR
jgi:hypothetical protein